MSRHGPVAGDAQTVRLIDLVTCLGTELAIEARIEYLDLQPGAVAVTFADVSKAGKHIGYSPRIGIQEGLRRFVAWYRSGQRQEATHSPCRSRTLHRRRSARIPHKQDR